MVQVAVSKEGARVAAGDLLHLLAVSHCVELTQGAPGLGLQAGVGTGEVGTLPGGNQIFSRQENFSPGLCDIPVALESLNICHKDRVD